jgi:DMSO/TMAO reductase YedYZ heme-binding membrane subunit
MTHRLLTRIGGACLLLTGGVAALFGLWAITAYVAGVVDVLDEPDQSWMFWGLVFLVLGVPALGAGAGACIAGWWLLQRRAPENQPDGSAG